jgi:hypothetical protein
MLPELLSVSELRLLRRLIAARLSEIRLELFGPDGGPELARTIGVCARQWSAFEAGAIIPGEVLLAFLDITGCCPRWLLIGGGPKYQHEASPSKSDRGSSEAFPLVTRKVCQSAVAPTRTASVSGP